MTLVVNAPHPFAFGDIFLAGGISNCPDWQKEAVQLLDGSDIIAVNPRRSVDMLKDDDAAAKQIAWEYDALRKCEVTLFWFPEETLCPITLFELGAALERTDKVAVGCHPNYARKFDVIHQVLLRRPEMHVHAHLNYTMANAIKLLS